ncbi:hypothetical protein TYRP_016608 [Tyrophagus putrescentiae]|nr:hypothetical protein TYRP_016608 [Tyrophagus putrescentiae]
MFDQHLTTLRGGWLLVIVAGHHNNNSSNNNSTLARCVYASLDLVLSLLLSPTDNIVESKNDGVAVVVVLYC